MHFKIPRGIAEFCLRTGVAVCLFFFAVNVFGQDKDEFFQRKFKTRPTLKQQLELKYRGIAVKPGSALEKLIRNNQDFSKLAKSEFSDSKPLPPWLRTWWRKEHPEGKYDETDPTGGYPLVLKEILEWMLTHQDLQSGPGTETEAEEEYDKILSGTIGANLRISGLQTVARSESDIRINFFDPTKILSGSNNIGGNGQQGIYYSTDSGATWLQTYLPLTAPDTSHSDPTVDWTSDGRAWSSTLGITGGTLRLRNYYSTDNGATWTLDATPSGSQTSVDKQMVWVDHSAASPYFNQQYAIWHNGNPVFMNRRTAGATGTWLASPLQVSGAETTGTGIGSDVKTNAAGDVFGFYPDTGGRGIYVVKSTNGGASYSTPLRVATTFDSYDIGVPSFAGRRALIYVSGGAYGSNVYLSWTDLSGAAGCTTATNEPGTNAASNCKTRIWFSRSTNGGTTWSTPVKINDQPGLNDQFNQWLAVDEATGGIAIMYYDTVADAGRKKTDVWYQASPDNGTTWNPAQKLTTGTTDETIAGADSGNQYGDYNSLSAYSNVIFPSWTDRRNALKEEIWTTRIFDTFTLAPIVATGGAATIASESCAPTNNRLDPGERVTVNLPLQNAGSANTSNLVATLRASGGAINPSSAQTYGVLVSNGAAVSRQFSFNVDSLCGGTVTLTLQLQDGATDLGTVTFTMPVGTTQTTSIFAENFDGVTAPALPAGWTTAQTGTTPPAAFATTATTPDTAPNAVFTNGATSISTNSLISPSITIPAGTGSQLSFRQTFNFERGTSSLFDGGVLEISTDNGATFANVTSVGGIFSAGGYTGTISTNFSSPIAGQPAWSGAQATYAVSTLNLPASFNGRTVKFRWRAGFDSSAAAANPNWRIDSITLSAVTPVCSTGCAVISAGGAVVAGRVTTAGGRGVARAQISLTDQNGVVRRAVTNPTGFFRFEDVAAGQSYIIGVRSKNYRFAESTRVLNVSEDAADLLFVAEP